MRIASSAKDKLGKGRWARAVAASWQHAYHIWLYHFMGGAEAKLQPPSAASEAGRQLAFEVRRDAIEAEKKFKSEAERLQMRLRTAIKAGESGLEQAAELRRLRSQA